MGNGLEEKMDIFESNNIHPMKVETRKVAFENCEVTADKLNFSNKERIKKSISEMRNMGVFEVL